MIWTTVSINSVMLRVKEHYITILHQTTIYSLWWIQTRLFLKMIWVRVSNPSTLINNRGKILFRGCFKRDNRKNKKAPKVHSTEEEVSQLDMQDHSVDMHRLRVEDKSSIVVNQFSTKTKLEMMTRMMVAISTQRICINKIMKPSSSLKTRFSKKWCINNSMSIRRTLNTNKTCEKETKKACPSQIS